MDLVWFDPMARVVSWHFVFDPMAMSEQELWHSKEVWSLGHLEKHHQIISFFLSFTCDSISNFQPSQIFISSPFHSISSFGALKKVVENHFLKVTLSSHLLGW